MEVLFSVAFILIWAFLDRYREFTNFESWWENSIFIKLQLKHPKLYAWLRSWDKDEIRYFKFWKFKIKLHPIFWDGYHFAKSLTVLLYLLLIAYQFGWPYFIAGAFFWWIVQNIAISIMSGGKRLGDYL